ncbi:MAG: biotin carboxylase N-terminal domain-containing protein [Blastocatellales bacterium]
MKRRIIEKILIANRGEIALRIIATCRAMGISTVAVCSDADLAAPHVAAADAAVRIGGPAPADSYLNIQAIVEAARRTGADAVHPGYGFLSENAEFAERCREAGLIFIGPSTEAIRSMGLKSAARRIAVQAGVLVVPGYDGDEQGIDVLLANINKIEPPVLIKASAGGGGRGMRVLGSSDDPLSAVESARREAEKAFGDGRLLIEKFIENARHVEIQIIGDNYGNLIHLGERDCSIQRRHQKVVEESPSPAVDEDLRRRMGEAAVGIGRAIGYSGAGTVEFLLGPDGKFYFIEVNTRLQVEHPVTEMLTGLDLVRMQIEIAEGSPLELTQDRVVRSGHSIEVRLYAEDPLRGFLPSSGTIVDWMVDDQFSVFARGEGLRIDCGIAAGSEIGIHYDPLLAKLIVHAQDRPAAIRRLASALRRTSVCGVATNREFLIRLLEHPSFAGGEAHTGFIAEYQKDLLCPREDPFERRAMIAVALFRQINGRRSHHLLRELPDRYRNNPWRDAVLKVRTGEAEMAVAWRPEGSNVFRVEISGVASRAEVVSCDDASIRLFIDGLHLSCRIIAIGDRHHVHSSSGTCEVEVLPRHPVHHVAAEEGSANSPMPGQVLKVLVDPGQKVVRGDPLVVLEAMKMEHTLRAAVDGTVEKILVAQGDVVGPGQVLVTISAE